MVLPLNSSANICSFGKMVQTYSGLSCCNCSHAVPAGAELLLLKRWKILYLLPPCCSPTETQFSTSSYGAAWIVTGKLCGRHNLSTAVFLYHCQHLGQRKSFSFSSFEREAASWLRSVPQVLESSSLLGPSCEDPLYGVTCALVTWHTSLGVGHIRDECPNVCPGCSTPLRWP